MYRLVKFPGVQVSRKTILTPPMKRCSLCGINNAVLLANLKPGIATSSALCTRLHTNNTDVVVTNELTKRKRFRREKKFYTELLEVLMDTSNQTKAPVRNLRPWDVSRIASSPNLELDNFHKIKNKSRKHVSKPNEMDKIESTTSTNLNETNGLSSKDLNEKSLSDSCFREASFSLSSKLETVNISKENISKTQISNKISNVEEPEQNMNQPLSFLHETIESDVLSTVQKDHHFKEGLEEEEYELQNENIENDTISSFNPAKKKNTPLPAHTRKMTLLQTKEKQAKEKMSDLEKKCKEKAFNATLLTYLNLCVSCNFLQRGISALHYYSYRSKMSVNNPKITDIRIFETLMRGFAAKANVNKVNELWKILTSVGLKPSIDVFASSLECAARSHKNIHQVSNIIVSLKEKGYNLNDIFVKCTFIGDQREVILKAIKTVEPRFEPAVPPPNICYSCSLLQDINKQQTRVAISSLRSPIEGIMNKGDLQRYAEEQFTNEFSSHLKVKSIEKRIESEASLAVHRCKLNSMKQSWMKDLKGGFHRDVTILEMSKRTPGVSLLPYMKVLDFESYIDIMMKEIQRLAEGSETFSPSTAQLYRNLGHQVKSRYIIKYKKTHGIVDKTKMLYDRYCDWYLNPATNNLRSCNGRQEWQQLIHDNLKGPSIVGDDEYWPPTVLIGIGRFLYNIIVGDVKIDVNILNKTNKQQMLPAFYRVYRHQGVKAVEEIKPHPVISKLYRAAGEEHMFFDITLVPMLCPPLPWTSYNTGGYLTAKTELMRLPDQALQQRLRLKEAPPDQLYPSLDSLNQLGSIPWKVNKPVLDTVIKVFNSGGSSKLEIPEPQFLCPVPEPLTPSMSKQERYQAYRQRVLLRRQKAEMYSLWCDALYKLSLANHFRDRVFWLPHNMDFRGRVYPCPPHLNHLSADMSRSLLCFAQGKRLGPTGLDWLKIHLVNLLGTKKRESIQDRLEFANAILPDILDSAEKPLTGKSWWMDSESPWQTLACCLEIYSAMQHAEGPENYVSHFPIHQDGSCNGLQHYAALGRDEAGACSVNLMPQDLPQDVYSCVAALVERERVKDAAAGLKVAMELDGFVLRKVIKQTVMTTVYGVTRFGARLQIAKQLKDIESFPKEYVWPASTYLVAKTFESLREMFTSTREIQDWFTECARQVSQICGENMEYVTPLGLPVVQHYSRQNKKLITFNGNKIGHLHEYFPIDMFERPNVMKQKNAFPPNFIHSLDSSHMMLTSIFSQQKGITFVSVHDCYWTHASTVHIMNQICREQFVALHSEPILEDLSNFMLNKYTCDERDSIDSNQTLSQAKQRLHGTLAQVPSKGNFILENVLDSIYFFS